MESPIEIPEIPIEIPEIPTSGTVARSPPQDFEVVFDTGGDPDPGWPMTVGMTGPGTVPRTFVGAREIPEIYIRSYQIPGKIPWKLIFISDFMGKSRFKSC